MATVEWTDAEQSGGGSGLPCKVKVDGETGGAWLCYASVYGPALAWMPNSEGVLNFSTLIGLVTHSVTIDQTAFDELTDNTKYSYYPITHPKP